MDIKRAYRFRFYPTPEQEVMLAQTFGCARFAYNYMLRLRTDAWFERQERVGYHETSAALTALKKNSEYGWLNEVSSVPIQCLYSRRCAIYKRHSAISSPSERSTQVSNPNTTDNPPNTPPAPSNRMGKR